MPAFARQTIRHQDYSTVVHVSHILKSEYLDAFARRLLRHRSL